MATKLLMGPKGDVTELRLSLDSMQKSDAKVFGYILVDFQILEEIQIWSDIINVQQLDRKTKIHEISRKTRLEYEMSKLS